MVFWVSETQGDERSLVSSLPLALKAKIIFCGWASSLCAMIPGFQTRMDGSSGTISEPAEQSGRRTTCAVQRASKRKAAASLGDDWPEVASVGDDWPEDWLIPGTSMTWLQAKEVDGCERVFCWVCVKAAQTLTEKKAVLVCKGCAADRLDNLKRHATSSQHQRALERLGFLEPAQRSPEAPSIDDFCKVAQRTPGQALQHGIPELYGAKKTTKMLGFLSDALVLLDKEFLRTAISIVLHSDVQALKLCISFRACNENLEIRTGVLGFEDIQSLAHDEIVRGHRAALTRLCSEQGVLDEELFRDICSRVELLDSDAAADATLANDKLRTELFPEVKTILRDKTHGCRRVISKPWSAVQAMQDAFSAVIGKPKSIARIIQSSKGISKMFNRACQEVLDAPCSGKRVKNLQYRKHRFDSQQRPLAKFILFFDAFVKVAIHLAADRNHSDTAHAEEFLSQVTDQQLILLSMCADASDEAVRLIRYFDSDTWDIASMQYECSVYASRLKHLFLDGQVVHSGYTQHMLETLKKSRGWLCRGRPRSIGGAAAGYASAVEAALQSLQAFVRVALETLQAEFPPFELLGSFMVFNVQSGRDKLETEDLQTQAAERLCQVLGFGFEEFLGEFAAHQPVAFYEARSGKDNFDAWKSAVLKSRASQKPVREHYPSEILTEVLARYGAWQSASTSGIERLFSMSTDHVPSDRQLLKEEHYFAEIKVRADLALHNKEDVAEIAQQLWMLHSGPPRKSCFQRLDEGCRRERQTGTLAHFVRKRRRAVEENAQVMSVDDVQAEVECLDLDMSLADEMAMDNAITFQKSKQWKNQCTAFLENALLESEVPDDMVDVAAAFLEHQDTLERERKRNVRNLQARLDPVAPRLQGKMVYLEKPEWQHMPFAADLELSAERRLAEIFVVEDYNSAQRSSWCCALQGGAMVDLEYAVSGGLRGTAFSYHGAVLSKRWIFICPLFCEKHEHLAEIVRTAAMAPGSHWKLLQSWEEFLERDRGNLSVLALTVPEMAAEFSGQKSVMVKATFYELI